MRISDWSSDVCSSDLRRVNGDTPGKGRREPARRPFVPVRTPAGRGMTTPFIPISALLLSVAILLMGNGLQGTLLPVRADIEGFTTLDIGVLGSAYFLGFAGGCLSGGRLIARVGHIREIGRAHV